MKKNMENSFNLLMIKFTIDTPVINPPPTSIVSG